MLETLNSRLDQQGNVLGCTLRKVEKLERKLNEILDYI